MYALVYTSTHLHTLTLHILTLYTPSHIHTLTLHPHIYTPSLYTLTLFTLTSTHPHSTHPHTSHILTSTHPHICTPSTLTHPHTLNPHTAAEFISKLAAVEEQHAQQLNNVVKNFRRRTNETLRRES